jgi:NAD(P)-dependent dehydrogenase (short-subunit alcohol dehydrogenase family)
MSRLFELHGRVAVVVGATSGLGRTLALGLAEHGADIAAAGRRENLAREVAAEAGRFGRRALAHPVDVLERSSVDALRDAVLAEFGRVDILVYAAGVTGKQDAAEFQEEDWTRIFDANTHGALRCAQSFYEPLKRSRAGRIVNIASLGSLVAFHGVAAYCASKAALLSMTRSLACEWARDGIRVNAIVPGVFPTELNRELIEGTERGRELLIRTPMGRFGRAEELVGAAVLLASDGASFLTGQSIAVDGGFLASGVNM